MNKMDYLTMNKMDYLTMNKMEDAMSNGVNVEKSVFKDEVTKRIVERAKDLGWTQVDIMKAVNAPKSTVNGWFTGVSMPNGMMLLQLCKVLRCNVDWLLSGSGSPVAVDSFIDFSSVPGVWEIGDHSLSAYYRIPRYDLNSRSSDLFDCKLYPASAFYKLKMKELLAWVECTDNSSDPVISNGDVLLIDSSVTEVSASGSFYAFAYGNSIRIHKAYVNIDGTLMLEDAIRPDYVAPVDADKVDVLGCVVVRYGTL